MAGATFEKAFLAYDLRFSETTKATNLLFPFFGATFFFPRYGLGMYNIFFFSGVCFLEYAQELVLDQSIKDQTLGPHG